MMTPRALGDLVNTQNGFDISKVAAQHALVKLSLLQ
jgi:hypothetical protein